MLQLVLVLELRDISVFYTYIMYIHTQIHSIDTDTLLQVGVAAFHTYLAIQ